MDFDNLVFDSIPNQIRNHIDFQHNFFHIISFEFNNPFNIFSYSIKNMIIYILFHY